MGRFHSRAEVHAGVRAMSTKRFANQESMSHFETGPVHLSERLHKQINAWCGLHGLMYTDGHIAWTPAPLSLLPNLFPRSSFDDVKNLQTIWNKLVDRISRDKAFLIKELREVGAADDFTGRLLKIYESIPTETVLNQLQFGIFRSDYMLNYDQRALQVEINTISSSFGSLSQKVSLFHKQLLERNINDSELEALVTKTSAPHNLSATQLRAMVEDNHSLEKIAEAIAAAHKAYARPDAVVLFIVQPNERNQGDQRALEQQLWSVHGVKCEFFALLELHTHANLSAEGHLMVERDGASFEVSVAYYRAGYTPHDYSSENEWQARELIERSAAVKCPSVGYHLAGTKAIQAALCKPHVLEQYLTVEESTRLRGCFAQQFALGDAETRNLASVALEEASQDGSQWVLKPQREGGGNNYYGAELSAFLQKHRDDPILSGFVLMQRIFPELQTTYFVRQGKCELAHSISELGIYGTYLGYGQDDKDIVNSFAGYLLRTKGSGTDEGGVATGYSVLNSIALI